jgi:hypothetical protein
MSRPLTARRGSRVRVAALALVAGLAAIVAMPSPSHAEGMFVAECDHTHRAKDDPIVYPRLPGRSHLHEFFGNRSTDASSTPASLRRAVSECTPKADRSAYWVPALYRGAKRVTPIAAQIYYQDFGRNGQVFPFPPGLRMIAGDVASKRLQPTYKVHWECSSLHAGGSQTIPTCTKEQGHVTLRVSFPDCWDGRRLDSPDHASHMAYHRDNGFEPYLQECPRSHPVLVPQLQVNVFYPMHDGRGVRLASGPIATAHADFFNAWRPKALARKVETVLNRGQACHPHFGCLSLPSNEGEPVVARPAKRLDGRFHPPARGGHGAGAHGGRHG